MLAMIAFTSLTGCAAANYDPPASTASPKVAAVPETPEQQRERYCKSLAWAQVGNGPGTGTFSGDMSAGLARANDALQRCRLNMPPAPPQPQPVYREPLVIDCKGYRNTLGTYDGRPKPPDGYTCREQ